VAFNVIKNSHESIQVCKKISRVGVTKKTCSNKFFQKKHQKYNLTFNFFEFGRWILWLLLRSRFHLRAYALNFYFIKIFTTNFGTFFISLCLKDIQFFCSIPLKCAQKEKFNLTGSKTVLDVSDIDLMSNNGIDTKSIKQVCQRTCYFLT